MEDGNREQLQKLRQQVERKKHLKSVLENMYIQQRELKEKVEELRQEKEEEQKDVDRLEGRGLTALFYSIIGKMDEKLTKEQREVFAAAMKYESAQQELASIDCKIEHYEKEIRELDDCEAGYKEELRKREEAVKASDSAEAKCILQLEEQITDVDRQLKEIREAMHAGQKAAFTTECVLGKLQSAEEWGTWDMLGGGIVSAMAKHGNLDDAQSEIASLQVELRNFKTELTDVSIEADLQVQIDDFMKFADYFFDGLFVDWAVQDRITKSKNKVRQVKEQIETVRKQLDQMQKEAEQEKADLQMQLEQMIVG